MLSHNILHSVYPSYTVPYSILVGMRMYLDILSSITKHYTVPCRHCMLTCLVFVIYIHIYIDNNKTDSGDQSKLLLSISS